MNSTSPAPPFEILWELEKIDNLTFSIGVIFFWVAVFCLSYALFGMVFQTFNNYPTFQKRAEFICYWTGVVHACISSFNAYYCYYYMCYGWENGVTPVNDVTCLRNPRDLHYKMMSFTGGFLFYDLILYKCIV